MVGITFAALLAIRSVAHSGQVVYLKERRPWIYVRSCSGALTAIYLDKELTTPIANPIIADKHGEYSYFTESPFGEVTVDWGGKPIVTRNCPVPKPGEKPAI